ncbi:MAG: hypothetical protein K0R07_2253 [Sedimentibacter sp.]|jgi:hypothetical protein|nr:hypothetical protein [Sedimentibacter sp.]
MKIKLTLLTALTITALTFAGVKVVMNQTENNVIHAQENLHKSSTVKNDADYEVIRKVSNLEDSSSKISYPQITGFKGELLMGYMNDSLRNSIAMYEKRDMYSNINIDYEITKMNNNILSVLFKGTGKLSGGRDIAIMQNVNLDINSSNEIKPQNLIKSDTESKNKVAAILKQKADAMGINFTAEPEGIRIYFKGDNVVFYFMPADDSAKGFVEINVPIKELEGFINSDFGKRPAS